MKLSDYIAEYLAEQGVKKVFLVTGGACAHIVDSIGKSKKIDYVCTQHEQAAAMAADAYARVSKNIGVAIATSGPGATNLITGVCCSYFDSIPVVMITGQVNLWETKGTKKIRQLGFQETDIIDIVRPITKFAVLVKDPKDIRYYLEKAVYVAKSGRPGPVWIDIPMNLQHAEIDPKAIRSFDPKELPPERPSTIPSASIKKVISQLQKAKRPVIVAGAGIKLGQAEGEFLKVLGKLKIPVVLSWSGFDILPHDHSLAVGQYGVYGNRAANFTVQNADLLLSLGSRLDSRQTGGQPQTFAREAFKIVVDIDKAELNKKWVVPNLAINADVKDLLTDLDSAIQGQTFPDISDWRATCSQWKKEYPAVAPEYQKQKGSVNSYVFTRAFAEKLPPKSIVIADTGGALTWTMQAFQIKKGQQLFSAFGNSPMGYSLPAAIGAAFANPKATIICITGDGGAQLNIQELQTIRHYNLPIKIFVLNNRAYGIIKQFQEVYFNAGYQATTAKTGYTTPDFIKVARAYGIGAETIKNHAELKRKIAKVLSVKGPVLCDVILDEYQKLIPKLVATRTPDGKYISKPIEDLTPLLPREEFKAHMITKPLHEDETKKPREIN